MRSKSEAQQILARIEPLLTQSIDSAWREYRDQYVALRYTHSPRTQSSLIRDLILHHAKQLFEGVPDTRFERIRGMDVLIVEDQLVVRFKKFDRRRRTSNIATFQARCFGEQLDLPGLPPTATKLNVGYQMNTLRTAYTAILVACPNGYRIAYSWDLLAPSTLELLPATSLPPAAADTSRRIRIKATEPTEKQGNDASTG